MEASWKHRVACTRKPSLAALRRVLVSPVFLFLLTTVLLRILSMPIPQQSHVPKYEASALPTGQNTVFVDRNSTGLSESAPPDGHVRTDNEAPGNRTDAVAAAPSADDASNTTVAILIVSDRLSRAKYAVQAASIVCYARKQNYEFVLLDPKEDAPLCEEHHKDFFFRKHCTVREWLRGQPRGRPAIVLDGDNMGGVSNVSLSKWLDVDDFDLAFYERSWNSEIMAGNYMLRNTPFTHAFLQAWANYEYVAPSGFTSSDNGAIHMVILDALAVRDRETCLDLYRALSPSVSNSNDLNRYNDFVACSRRLLGPPRTHRAYDSLHRRGRSSSGVEPSAHNATGREDGQGEEEEEEEKEEPVAKITVFPKFFGFSVDGGIFGTDGRLLHPFHHGEKNGTRALHDYYIVQGGEGMTTSEEEVGCVGAPEREVGREEFAETLRSMDKYVFDGNFDGDWGKVPRWEQADKTCYDRLWCPPMHADDTHWPKGSITIDGEVRDFEYEDPGRDWFNPMATMHDHFETMT